MTATLYKHFTSASQLDEQYDIEATVPDFGEYVTQYVTNSQVTRDTLHCELDVRYGPTLDETLDIFYPSASDNNALRPAVFFVHGGFWKATTSKEWSYVAKGLAKLGFVTAIENYSLCPKVSVSEIVRQHKAAFYYFWQNAEALGVDRNKIVLVGHSVGAHGVAHLLSTDWPGEYGLPPSPYRAAVAVSGLIDVRPVPYTFANPILKISHEDAVSLSPVLTQEHGKVPLLVTVGNEEPDEFLRQSADFAIDSKLNGWAVESRTLNRNHFNILDEFLHGEGEMVSFVRQHLES